MYCVDHYNETTDDYDEWYFPCKVVLHPKKLIIKRTGPITFHLDHTVQPTSAITRFFEHEELEIEVAAECAFTVACCMLNATKPRM